MSSKPVLYMQVWWSTCVSTFLFHLAGRAAVRSVLCCAQACLVKQRDNLNIGAVSRCGWTPRLQCLLGFLSALTSRNVECGMTACLFLSRVSRRSVTLCHVFAFSDNFNTDIVGRCRSVALDNLLPFTVGNSCGYTGFLDFVSARLERYQRWFDCCVLLFHPHLGTCHRLQAAVRTSLMKVVKREHEVTTPRLNLNRVLQLEDGGFQFVSSQISSFSSGRRGSGSSLASSLV